MQVILFGAALAIQAIHVAGHMAMTYPAPLRSSVNPFANPSTIDYSMTSPLAADGSNFPCKSYLSDLSTSAGTPVTSWAAGSTHNFTISGGASHDGGSCQAALSYDSGKTFTVIHSYIGNCPLIPSFNFNVPSDAPLGNAVFSWTWFNKVGNREMYQNCASVTITAGSGSKRRSSTPFSTRPTIFVANVGGSGCTTIETTDLKFPNPGPDADVTINTNTFGSVKGTCLAVHGNGGSSVADSNSGSSVSSAAVSAIAPASSIKSVPSATTIATNTIYASAAPSSKNPLTSSILVNSAVSSASPTPSSVSPAVINVSVDGQCSGSQTCSGSEFGPCCSSWGWCGNTADHCGVGCMTGFGSCGLNLVGSMAGSASASPPAAKSSESPASSVPSPASSLKSHEMSTKTKTKTIILSTTTTSLGSTMTGAASITISTYSISAAAAPSTFVTSVKKPSSSSNLAGEVTIIPVETAS